MTDTMPSKVRIALVQLYSHVSEKKKKNTIQRKSDEPNPTNVCH